MLHRLIFVCFLFTFQIGISQNGFQFEGNRNKTTIPFKFINNLILITIDVNGTPLNFLLDTGVEDSVLFSVDDTDGVSFSNIEKYELKVLVVTKLLMLISRLKTRYLLRIMLITITLCTWF